MHYTDFTLSELEKKRVVDADGVRAGKIKDVRFDEKGAAWFILGGGFVRELLEKLRMRHDIDLLVPAAWISAVNDDEIELTQSVFQLESTCQECWIREKERLIAASADPRNGPPTLRLTDTQIL